MDQLASVAQRSAQAEALQNERSVSPTLWRATWERWKQIAHAIGVVQTRFLMIFFYAIFVLPVGLVVRRRQDRLRLKPPSGSLWLPHPENKTTLESARRQF
jgi:hypothetical protein